MNPFESDRFSAPVPSLDSQLYARHGAIVDALRAFVRAAAREVFGRATACAAARGR